MGCCADGTSATRVDPCRLQSCRAELWYHPLRFVVVVSAANSIAAAHNEVIRIRALHDSAVAMSQSQLAQAELRWRQETQQALATTRQEAEKLVRDREMALEAARLRVEMVRSCRCLRGCHTVAVSVMLAPGYGFKSYYGFTELRFS